MNPFSKDLPNELMAAIKEESSKFQEFYFWLEKAMPRSFFDEVDRQNILLIAHYLMGFHLQNHFSIIHLTNSAIVLCLDSSDADLRILKNYTDYGIKNYKAYVSLTPPPLSGVSSNLRIGLIYFTEAIETIEKPYPNEAKEILRKRVKERNPDVTDEEFHQLIQGINSRFLRENSTEQLIIALDMFFRAKTRDHCQYELTYNENWQKDDSPSAQIMLAWRNTSKQNFLYRLARLVQRHQLMMKQVNATYIDPYAKHSILIMSLGLHGCRSESAWEAANMKDFLQELVTLKYSEDFDEIDKHFVTPQLITGNMGNFLRVMISFAHQSLVHLDANLYTIDNIEEAVVRHPELAIKLCSLFSYKFDPDCFDLNKYETEKKRFIALVEKLDTGHQGNDDRRKNVLTQGLNFIEFTLKTNFFRNNKTAFGFRLDPKYLDEIPFNRSHKFPELPFGIFFITNRHYLGFHIRFKDLARGGVRTVFPEQRENMLFERNNVFTECYNLAYTQQKKNKDIPEGGAKAIILLKPFERLHAETDILRRELENSKIDKNEIGEKLENFQKEQRAEYLYQSQRSFIEVLLSLINYGDDGSLKAKNIIDYWLKPEFLYLGPDENMHNSMIQWIADYSVKCGYSSGSSFISSKPNVGINHKEYGVTSLGINVYMHQALLYLGINPEKDIFTVKISGGPDGDVAGNQICNLYRYYPRSAKLLALTDISGTIYDPEGLHLDILFRLFQEGNPIKHYPSEALSEGGFLLDKSNKRNLTPLVQQTLCLRKTEGNIYQDWLSGSEMSEIFRTNVHKTKTDVFIPAGGRPRTLNESNFKEFLNESGEPTSRVVIEGANLYFTQKARRILEEKGVLIIKDSSANKAGVICSSFEVLCGLTLKDDAAFLKHKETIVGEILDRLRLCALQEASLLLEEHRKTGCFMTDISEKISEKINFFTNQLLGYLENISISKNKSDPLNQCFLSYCLPFLREKFQEKLMEELPEEHKKAIIACHIASQIVYKRGLAWFPSIVDILPLIWKEQEIFSLEAVH